MKWTGVNELREKYLSFFESKGHLRAKSAPLIPEDEKSLLLINAGMAPLKKYFSGQAVPPALRMTTCQKCIRVNDIENVGVTARHLTFFEMLGNFSFGDYFKTEALTWAWELSTQVLEIPAEKIWASIYEDDDEAFDIWVNVVGLPAERVVRLGKEDNFWEIGAGPCGPCSELYFDRGAEYGCGSPDCKPGCDCDRYMEYWNNVFTQFDSDGKGGYTPLAKKNIDTGLGLERLACIFQNVDSVYDIDTFKKVREHVCRVTGAEYGRQTKTDTSVKIVTEHARSTVFMIGDGILPSNEGRGYILRRLLRRAARHGRLLGMTKPFLHDICETVIAENESAYPELREQADYIKRVITEEEKRFHATIEGGSELLERLISGLRSKKTDLLDGGDAFKLYDTYGFPVDLTKEICAEQGISVDIENFEMHMQKQREAARSARAALGVEGWETNESIAKLPATAFLGYEKDSCDCNVLAILSKNEVLSEIGEQEDCALILDKTVFYAESGGQVGSRGRIVQKNGVFVVNDCKKSAGGQYLHYGFVESGSIACLSARAELDLRAINSTMRNHTAAHLLQAALKKVLGDHVHQAGQLVDDKRMRFDFTHFSAIAKDELAEIERIVNDTVLAALPVVSREMKIEEAKREGAIALFGEKYGDVVRVVSVGEVSSELCGGTHVDNTAKLGLFKILSESSVASGVRRIEAVTGENVLELINRQQKLLSDSGELLKIKDTGELPAKIMHYIDEAKGVASLLAKNRARLASLRSKMLYTNIQRIGDIGLITARIDESDGSVLREMAENMVNNPPPPEAHIPSGHKLVIVLASVDDGKGSFVVACTKEAVGAGLKAGDIAREVAMVTGGNGGGRPDFAMSGAKDLERIDQALSMADEIIRSKLKS